jgi:hypothetical protein
VLGRPGQGDQIRVARFCWIEYTKTGTKYTDLTLNYQKGPEIYQNGFNIFQMAIKCTNIFHSKALKIYPYWDCWFENIPSSHPGPDWAKLGPIGRSFSGQFFENYRSGPGYYFQR